jgi:hypothetical protein
LFPVVDANSELAADAAKNRLIFEFKRQVVERAARKRLRKDQPLADFHTLSTNLRSCVDLDCDDVEYAIAYRLLKKIKLL